MPAPLFTVLTVASGPRMPAHDWASVARQASLARSTDATPPSPCSNAISVINGLAPRLLAQFNVSGMSVGLICNHTVVLATGFGVADRENGITASDTTRYQIASNTKLFTSTLLLQLADEGRLDLDRPVRDAFPEFVFNNPYGAESLTPRDLLSHRTGLPRHDRITFASATRMDMMRAVGYLPLDKAVRYQPGEYNNMMLVAAGVVAEHAGNAQWEDLVSTRIFDRLNMSDTYPNLSTAIAKAPAHSRAVPYVHIEDAGTFRPLVADLADVGAPCGAIVSSVRDMLKWQQMHLRQAEDAVCISTARETLTLKTSTRQCPAGASVSGRSGPKLLHDATWLQFLHSNSIFPMLTSFGGYSMGLWVEPWASSEGLEAIIHHEGDLAGMASLQMMLPMRGSSFVVLTNENESPARYALALSVLDALLGLQPAVPSWEERYLAELLRSRQREAKEAMALRQKLANTPKAGRVPRFPLAAYTGSFVHPAYGNATVSVRGGGLQLCGAAALRSASPSRPSTPTCAPLLHVYYETWALGPKDVAEVTPSVLMITFCADGDGHVSRFEAPVEPKVDPIAFTLT